MESWLKTRPHKGGEIIDCADTKLRIYHITYAKIMNGKVIRY